MQLVPAGCCADVLPLLNHICTQQHEAHHGGKNWAYSIVCLQAEYGGSNKENVDATDRTAEVVTAE